MLEKQYFCIEMSGKGSISRMSDECLMTLETVISFCTQYQAVMRKFTLALIIFRVFLELLHQWAHLNGLWTGSKYKHYCFHIYRFYSFVILFLFFCLERLHKVERFERLKSMKGELIISFVGFQLQDGSFST